MSDDDVASGSESEEEESGGERDSGSGSESDVGEWSGDDTSPGDGGDASGEDDDEDDGAGGTGREKKERGDAGFETGKKHGVKRKPVVDQEEDETSVVEVGTGKGKGKTKEKENSSGGGGKKAKTEKTRPAPKKEHKKAKARVESKEEKPSQSGARPRVSSKKKPIDTTSSGGGEEDAESKLEELVRKKGPLHVADRFRRLTLLESILRRPDTYVGSLSKETEKIFVYDSSAGRMVRRKLSFVPGLYKIFDEILVNAADQWQRCGKTKTIAVEVHPDKGRISVYNDGAGIPVQEHHEYGVYVPELVFGELLTGENYNDEEQRLVGGRNGYGAKLANIFSTTFTVETNDPVPGSGHYFKQVWTGNMKSKGTPEVRANKGKAGWTRVTFVPDLSKFGMTHLDADTLALFQRRVYDLAGVCHGVKVTWNGEAVKFKDFRQYCGLFLPPDAGDGCVVSKTERWEVVVAPSYSGAFEQVSFVNAVCTLKGGTHVAAVTDQVAKGAMQYYVKKHKSAHLKPQMIKNQLFVFVNARIVNPRFDSQTKVTLTSGRSEFGSKWTMDAAFLKKVVKMPTLTENVTDIVRLKESKGLKKTDGKKKSGRLSGIEKLEEANWAGGRRAQECTLILTEGESAKTLAMAGLDVVGRDAYGVYPLRGKILNVRDAKVASVQKNEEIAHIKQILGLKSGVTYEDTSSLRYGHLMIMADQDHDGSHIKGLVINLFSTYWPSLLRLPGFLKEFITPIVKATRGHTVETFYTIPEYQAWRTKHGSGWTIKYYKGLGTSSPKEAQEYFSDLPRHQIDFAYSGESDDKSIALAFDKKSSDLRKTWLGEFKSGTFLEADENGQVTYSDFVNKELILFSVASNVRALPSVVDGLKPGQRKILYACFKRKLTKEIKVAQLAGYVSEHTSYHHAETALADTIVNLAQNFTGSNNINLLYPSGQFGSRLEGGKDSASPRYIFTRLESIARLLFPAEDDACLNYLDDDGKSVEPEWFVPILPMVLVNGANGIGTGYRTSVPAYHPRELVRCIEAKLDGRPSFSVALHPWYKGFIGTLSPSSSSSSSSSSSASSSSSSSSAPAPSGTGDPPTAHATDENHEETKECQSAPPSAEVGGVSASADSPASAPISAPAPAKKTTPRKRESKAEYVCRGILEKTSPTTYTIRELPIGRWNVEWRSKVLDPLKEKGEIESYTEDSTLYSVSVTVECTEEQARKLDDSDLYKKFALSVTVSLSNLVLHDATGRLRKYGSVYEIVDDFYAVRLDFYKKRHAWLTEKLQSELRRISNKLRFVLMVISDELQIRNVKKAAVIVAMTDMKFDRMEKVSRTAARSGGTGPEEPEDEDEEEEEEEKEREAKGSDDSKDRRNYDYLLSMPLWSLTMERVEELKKERAAKEGELAELKKTTVADMWRRDLAAFVTGLDEHEARERAEKDAAKRKSKSKSKSESKSKTKTGTKTHSKEAKSESRRRSKKEGSDKKSKETVTPKESKPTKKTIPIGTVQAIPNGGVKVAAAASDRPAAVPGRPTVAPRPTPMLLSSSSASSSSYSSLSGPLSAAPPKRPSAASSHAHVAASAHVAGLRVGPVPGPGPGPGTGAGTDHDHGRLPVTPPGARVIAGPGPASLRSSSIAAAPRLTSVFSKTVVSAPVTGAADAPRRFPVPLPLPLPLRPVPTST
jgi:DNA topoisomerase-2